MSSACRRQFRQSGRRIAGRAVFGRAILCTHRRERRRRSNRALHLHSRMCLSGKYAIFEFNPRNVRMFLTDSIHIRISAEKKVRPVFACECKFRMSILCVQPGSPDRDLHRRPSLLQGNFTTQASRLANSVSARSIAVGPHAEYLALPIGLFPHILLQQIDNRSFASL